MHSLFRVGLQNSPCGKVFVQIYQDDLDSNAADYTTVCDGTWHHVAVTFTGSLLAIFVDGTEEASRDASYMTTGAGSQLLLGWTGAQIDCGNGCAFTGALDDVRVYARALAPA